MTLTGVADSPVIVCSVRFACCGLHRSRGRSLYLLLSLLPCLLLYLCLCVCSGLHPLSI